MRPGEPLREAELCARFGVSRTVIREVLRILEAEGLVATLSSRGPVVRELSARETADVYEVRLALEGLTAALFAQRASEADRRALRRALQRLESAAHTERPRQYQDAKLAFYDALAAGAANPTLTRQLNQLQAQISTLRALTLSKPGRRLSSLGECRAIVEAIESTDPSAARAAAEDHVRAAMATALELIDDAGPAEAGGSR